MSEEVPIPALKVIVYFTNSDTAELEVETLEELKGFICFKYSQPSLFQRTAVTLLMSYFRSQTAQIKSTVPATNEEFARAIRLNVIVDIFLQIMISYVNPLDYLVKLDSPSELSGPSAVIIHPTPDCDDEDEVASEETMIPVGLAQLLAQMHDTLHSQIGKKRKRDNQEDSEERFVKGVLTTGQTYYFFGLYQQAAAGGSSALKPLFLWSPSCQYLTNAVQQRFRVN